MCLALRLYFTFNEPYYMCCGVTPSLYDSSLWQWPEGNLCDVRTFLITQSRCSNLLVDCKPRKWHQVIDRSPEATTSDAALRVDPPYSEEGDASIWGGRVLYGLMRPTRLRQIGADEWQCQWALDGASTRVLVQCDLPHPHPGGKGPVLSTWLCHLSSATNMSSLVHAHQNLHHGEAQIVPPS